MIPFNPHLAFAAGLVPVLIPILTTWPGVSLPPWVGLGLAVMAAAAAYTLKQMAPAADVHKDSELPAQATAIDTDALAAALLPALIDKVADAMLIKRAAQLEQRYPGAVNRPTLREVTSRG